MTTRADPSVESRYTPATSSAPPPESRGLERRWHLATLIAFRFAFVYFGLTVLMTQMLTMLVMIPDTNGIPELDGLGAYRRVVLWVGARVFGTVIPFSFLEQVSGGSGDTTFDWVEVFTLLVVAALAAAIWSAVARERGNHARLYAWFRTLLRFALGTTMITYGLMKIIPLQMPAPDLARLLEQFGDFSPISVLWSSIGASPAYEMIAGAAEVAGGLLVMIPQTAKIGAILCLFNTANVFVLNMTYDVPVKQFSFHLVVMSLLLLAPDARRLVNIFLRGRAERLTAEPTLEGSVRQRRIATGLQIAYAVYIAAYRGHYDIQAWHQRGGGAPKSPLYGIWDVQRMTIDGEDRAPLFTDSTRWRGVLFDAPGFMQIRLMPGVSTPFVSTIDTVAHTIALRPTGDPSSAIDWGGRYAQLDSTKSQQTLAYTRPERSRLVMDGAFDGHTIHVDLAYRNPNDFMVRSRGFHWVQARAFGR